MSLETIIEMYGWNDYYEMLTGKTYLLSQARVTENGLTRIPVEQDGEIIGYTVVNMIKGE